MRLHPWTLLRLYPPAWRDRYGDEFVALLEKEGTGPRVVLSVLAGAFDAWVSPQKHDRYAPADVDTLRFWRVQMPPDNRTFGERLPQMALGLVLFALVKSAAAVTAIEMLDRAAVPIAVGVAMIPTWYAGYSLQTKVLAAVAMAIMAFVTTAIGIVVLSFLP
jgi:hypothetical protein